MRFLHAYRFSFLLVTLLVFVILTPLVEHFDYLSLILNILLSAILLTSINTLLSHNRSLVFGLILAVPLFALSWLYAIHPAPLIERAALLIGSLFFIHLTLIIVINLPGGKEISLEVLAGAASAYLMIGFTWSFIYGLLESLSPGSFSNIHDGIGDPRYRFTYFSFVTLTTLGYGDITPQNPIAEAWTILEAIIGQLYLVIVISGLVGIYVSSKQQH